MKNKIKKICFKKEAVFAVILLLTISAFTPTMLSLSVTTINSKVMDKIELNDQESKNEIKLSNNDVDLVEKPGSKMLGGRDLSDPWWNYDWQYRKPITIDRTKVISGPHLNFPVLISLSSDADLAGKAKSDGDDIVFVNNATGTKLNHEIELYNNSNGNLVCWVNVTSLSSTEDTVLYMYYGNSGCSNQENPVGVWDSNFVMVQHLNETSGTCNDSTYLNNDGHPVGGLNQSAVGIIDGADSFNGINSTYFVHDTGSLAGFTSGFTLSAWIKLNDNTLRQSIFGKWSSYSNTRAYLFEFQQHATFGKVLLFAGTSSASGSPQTYTYSVFTPTVGVWYHVAAVWQTNQYAKLYVNGVLATVKAQGTYITSIYNNILEPLFIGSLYNNTRGLNGYIDEIRVAKIVRPVGCLTTEYNNQNNPNTFYTIENEETRPEHYPIVLNISPVNNSINIPVNLSNLSFKLRDYVDLMNYSVDIVPDVIGGVQSGSNISDNTTINIPIIGGPLDYNTNYIWQVNVTDRNNYWTNETFNFITQKEPITNPFAQGWMYYKIITIDHSMVAANLTNFPVLFNLESDADLSSKAQPDGDDILFMNDNGTAIQLNHQIERYNSSTGNLVCWVNVTNLSSITNTRLYMYYGNPSCSNQENPESVWDSNFVMVQHLDETSGTHYDSTSYNNDATPVNVTNQDAVGKIDGADSLNGVKGSISVPHNSSISGFTSGMTLSAWVKYNNVDQRQGILTKWETGTSVHGYLFEYQKHATYGGVLLFVASKDGGTTNQEYLYSAFVPTIGTWYHVAVVWKSNVLSNIYLNGVLATMKAHSPAISNIMNNPNEPLFIGSMTALNNRVINGTIDETRISNTARSVDWLVTEYNNQNSPNTFCTIGNELYNINYSKIINPNPSDGLINVLISLSEINFVLIDFQGNLMNYTVSMIPDVIGGLQIGNNVVNDTTIHVPITDGPLDYSTTYTWQVNVTNGAYWTNKTFSFITGSNYASPPTNFKATTINRTQINLTWTLDTMANTTYIEQNSEASWTIREGTMIYNDTGAAYNDIGLIKGTTYYYQAWSYNNTYNTYSVTYASTNATTIPNLPPTLSNPNPPTGSTGISLQPICRITVDDKTDDELDVCFYSSNDNNSWIFEKKNADISTVGGAVNLIWDNYSRATNYHTKYYWKVTVDNGTNNITYYYNFMTIGDFDFAIIAYSDWYGYDGEWDLQRLADWHNTNDALKTYIINISTILNNPNYWVNGTWGDANPSNIYRRLDEAPITKYSMFNDTQAKIRNYIRYAHHDLGVTYVLLVGDNDTLPVRCFFGWGLGNPGYNANIASDMYYGCLNGTFNDDQDTYVPGVSGWGEDAYWNSHGIDENDWEFEVAIGRFPAHNVTELSNNVMKTILYMSQDGTEDYLYNITLAAGWCGWGTIHDGINFSIQLKGAILTRGGITTHGFDENIYEFKILCEDLSVFNSILMNTSNSRATFNAGTHIWYHASHGNISTWRGLHGGDNFTVSDVENLTNTQYCFVVNPIACSPGSFDLGYSIAEAFVNTEHGAFATIQNARIGYASNTNSYDIQNQYYGREVIDAYFNEGITRLGDINVDAIHDCMWFFEPGKDPLKEASYSLHQKNLLGSPAVQMKLPTIPQLPPMLSNEYPANNTYNVNITQGTVNVTIEDPNGTPFNWTIEGQYVVNTGDSGSSNGSKSAFLITPLPKNTLIIWYVNATDGKHWTRETFSFITGKETITNPIEEGWQYYKIITVDHSKVAANLTNFPVLFNLESDVDLASHAQSDGDDILFMNGNGTAMQLNHQIEYYNSSTGNLVCWVNVTNLSSINNTTIYMYYGNPSSSSQENPVGVWGSNYVMVQHLSETDGKHYDSTIYNNDATPVNVSNQNALGKIDGADSLNGVQGSISVPHSDSISGFTSGLTFSAWVKFNNVTQRQGLLVKWNANGTNVRSYLFEYQKHATQGKCILFDLSKDGASDQYYQYSAFSPTIGVWYHITAVWQPNQYAKIYVNGVLATVVQQNSPISSVKNNPNEPLLIGSMDAIGTRVINGTIDETRISNIARSANWLLTEYNNQNNPETFYTIGIEETSPGELKTVVSVNAPTHIINPGTNFSIDVNCTPAQDMRGFQFNLSFNTTLLEAYNVTNLGEIFTSHGYLIFSNFSIDNSTGNISYVYASVLGMFNVSTPGRLATIEFTAKKAIGISHLNLYNVKIVNLTHYLDTIVYNSTVTVNDTIPPDIANIQRITSIPLDTNPSFGWVNITCNVTDNLEIKNVFLKITNPDDTYNNVTMSKTGTNTYYLNSTTVFAQHGNYDYHIWANDTVQNINTSSSYLFYMPPNYDINGDGVIDIMDINLPGLIFGNDVDPGSIREDVDNNGVVDILDISIISYHFGDSWI